MNGDPSDHFRQLLAEARADSQLLGLYVSGSRGKGFEDQSSDYDVGVIMADEATEADHARYMGFNSATLELWTSTLSQFRDEAPWDWPMMGERYSFAHVTAQIDKCAGEIQRLIDEKGSIPADRRVEWVRGCLGGYINSLYRSLKCMRKHNMRGAQLEAHDSIGFLLDVLFGYEGRQRPYYGYLERELRTYPLASLPISGDELLAKIDAIAASADRATQQELLAMVDALLRPAGFGDVIDDWEDKYEWMRSYKG
jgi:hypothetical protein